MTFELKGVNMARIRVDARCEWMDTASGEAEEFVLICPCQGERMYEPSGLVQDPPFNFFGVFSRTQSHIIRQFADAGVQRDTVENHAGRFTSVRIDVAPAAGMKELVDGKAVCDATLANRPLVARTEMRSPDGRSRVLMEYPVTTMNVEPGKRIWQVDTGPVLIPDFGRAVSQRIEKLVPGFIVYNRPDYVEWTLRAPARLPAGGQTHHYTDIRTGAAASRLYAA
jgi:hypothetical protein